MKNLKQHITVKNLLILIVLFYFITAVERFIGNQSHQSDILMKHSEKNNELVKQIESLNNNIHNYEKKKLQNTIDIINMDDAERDSLRAMLNPR
jgi:hypothetical protein